MKMAGDSLSVRVRECDGRGVTESPLHDGAPMSEIKSHSHESNPKYLEVIHLKKRLLQRSASEGVSLKRIFDEECARVPNDVSSQVGYDEVVSAMYKRRRSVQPAVPPTLQQYGQMLAGSCQRFATSFSGEPFLRTTISGNVSGTSVVFGSSQLLANASETRELHIDSTFKITPRVPQCYQLLTVMSVHFDHAFPVITVLMEKKNQEAYTEVFQLCKQLLPELTTGLRIITDFETALQNAAREVFEGSIVQGCWFHFASALFKKAKKGGLYRPQGNHNEVQLVIQMCMALPLLPKEKLIEGYEYIKNYASRQGVAASTRTFLKYVQRQWIRGIGPNILSVFGQPSRTNNFQEAYHRTLLRVAGKPHPPVWEFTDCLRSVENNSVRKLESLKSGRRVSQNTRKKYLLQDKKIANASAKLTSDPPRYSIGEFLRCCSNTVNSFARASLGREDEDDSSASDLEEHEEEDIAEHEALPASFSLTQPATTTSTQPATTTSTQPATTTSTQPATTTSTQPATTTSTQPATTTSTQPATTTSTQPTLPPSEVQIRPDLYHFYRVRPIQITEEDFMDIDKVLVQKEELLLSLQSGDEPSFEADEGEVICTICICFKATRVCSPCGHAVVCRQCLPGFIAQDNCYCITMGDGSILQTTIRLPVTCPTCRAIVGQLIQTF